MAIQQDAPGAEVYFQPRRLGHANIFISDVEKSMDFYQEVLGIEEVYRRPPVKAGFLSNGNTHHDIGMVEYSGPAGWKDEAGLNHIAFELETQVDLVDGYRRAEAAGIHFPRTIDHEIAHALYFSDPDGNRVEIYADTTRDWRNRRTGLVQNPTYEWTPGSVPPSPEILYNPDPEIRRIDAAVFHPKRITHCALAVVDFAGAYAHYTDKVGLRPMIGGPDSRIAALGGTCGARDLVLIRADGGREPGLHHMGFVVWDEADLEKSIERMRREGITHEADVDHSSRRSIVVRDPDGLRIQFYVDRGAAPNLEDVDEDVAIYLA